MAALDGFKRSIAPYREKPVLANFLLGWGAGVPLSLALSTLSYWLAFEGVDKKTIGIFASVSAPYVFKPLWSPLLDKVSLGPITRLLGQRRGWLLIIQLLLAAALIAIASTDPSINAFQTGVFAMAITICSASQDIVVDAYRLELMSRAQYGRGAAMYTYGYRAANLVTVFSTLYIAEFISWSLVYILSPILLLPSFLALVFWLKEAEKPDNSYIKKETQKLQASLKRAGTSDASARWAIWAQTAFILPFKEFATRSGWFWILMFIFLFKLGDVLLAFMTAPFLVELEFSKSELATANKLVGGIMTWIGVFVGAWTYDRLGIYRSLLLSAILMMATNLTFVWLNYMGHDLYALAITIGAESFASGLSSVALVVFFSGLTSREFTATQYAMLTGLAGVARMVFGSASGYFAEAYSWVDFFLLSALASIPSIIVLRFLHKKGWGGMRDEPPKKQADP